MNHGSIKDLQRTGRPKYAGSEEMQMDIAQAFVENPHLSLRWASEERDVAPETLLFVRGWDLHSTLRFLGWGSGSTKCQTGRGLSISSECHANSLYLSRMHFKRSVFDAFKTKICRFLSLCYQEFLFEEWWFIKCQTCKELSIPTERRVNSFYVSWMRNLRVSFKKSTFDVSQTKTVHFSILCHWNFSFESWWTTKYQISSKIRRDFFQCIWYGVLSNNFYLILIFGSLGPPWTTI